MQLEREVGKRRKQMRQLGPLLKGTLIERKIPCGKANCRCKYEEGHPGLYLTYSLEGKTKTVYIPKKIAPKAKKWSKNYSRFRQLLEEMFQLQLKIIKRNK